MAIRRETRLRKEFLFKREIDAQASTKNEKKRKLKEAIDEGKSIPTELFNDARQLHHESSLDLERKPAIDDEYAQAGARDPKVCVTTSRDPGSRLKQFAKEIKLCIPNAQAINRGSYRVDELVEAAKKADFTDIVIVNETRGNPDNLIVCHLPFGPTAYFTLSNTILRHDIPDCQPVSLQYPHLIIDGLSSKVGQRIGRILQALYPGPNTKSDSKRLITFANNNNDFISFRHHTYTKDNSQGNRPDAITLKECGPRFELQPYEIRLGTVEQNDTAEKEWVLRPYMNTSRKQSTL